MQLVIAAFVDVLVIICVVALSVISFLLLLQMLRKLPILSRRSVQCNPTFLSMGTFRRREILAHMHNACRERSYHQNT